VRRKNSRHQDEALLEKAIDEKIPRDAAVREFLRLRYLPYLRQLEDGASRYRVFHYSLRIPALTLSAIVPVLVAANLGDAGQAVTIVIGVVVAGTIAVEQVFNSGARWRHYRGAVEAMKSDLWLFIERAGDYAQFPDHGAARTAFVTRAEALARGEFTEYLEAVVAAPRGSAAEQAGPAGPAD
jgi:hypothetical protein